MCSSDLFVCTRVARTMPAHLPRSKAQPRRFCVTLFCIQLGYAPFAYSFFAHRTHMVQKGLSSTTNSVILAPTYTVRLKKTRSTPIMEMLQSPDFWLGLLMIVQFIKTFNYALWVLKMTVDGISCGESQNQLRK